MNSNKNSIITISGEPRSGKSTTISALKEYYSSKGKNVVHVSIGDLVRKLAQEEGVSITEFNKRLATNPEIDKKFDTFLMDIGKKINQEPQENTVYLIDSRMAWHFIPDAFSIRLTVDENEAGKRALNDTSRKEDTYSTLEEAIASTAKREEIEVARYKSLYGVDITDTENYNLVIDTTEVPTKEIVDIIENCFSLHQANQAFAKHWRNAGYFLPTQDVRQSVNWQYPKTKESITNDGFDPQCPITSVYAFDTYWVVDGHNRVGATCESDKTLVAYELLASNNETSPELAGNLTAEKFVANEALNYRGSFLANDYTWWTFDKFVNLGNIRKKITEYKNKERKANDSAIR